MQGGHVKIHLQEREGVRFVPSIPGRPNLSHRLVDKLEFHLQLATLALTH